MEGLTITSTKILPIKNGNYNCVAIAQVVLNDSLKLTSIKMYVNKKNRYITYPRNMSSKHKKSYFYPLNNELADMINATLWAEYDKIVESETK